MTTPESRKSRELGRLSWPDVAGVSLRTLLVPVGSCEQHGPHLPLDTDTRIASAVALRVAAVRDDTWVAPPVSYGSSGEHQAFPGTLSIGSRALTVLLVELGRSALPDGESGAAGPGRVVFVNGHGGNQDAVQEAVDVLVAEDRAVRAWAPRIPGADAHAGRTETSLLLAIDAGLVGPDRPVGNTVPIIELLPGLRREGVRPMAANGVLGDARGASAEDGASLLQALAADLASLLDEPAP